MRKRARRVFFRRAPGRCARRGLGRRGQRGGAAASCAASCGWRAARTVAVAGLEVAGRRRQLDDLKAAVLAEEHVPAVDKVAVSRAARDAHGGASDAGAEAGRRGGKGWRKGKGKEERPVRLLLTVG